MCYLIRIFERKGYETVIIFFGEIGNRFIKVKAENHIGGKLLNLINHKFFRERGSYWLVVFILVSSFSRPILLRCRPPEIWISNLWLLMLPEGESIFYGQILHYFLHGFHHGVPFQDGGQGSGRQMLIFSHFPFISLGLLGSHNIYFHFNGSSHHIFQCGIPPLSQIQHKITIKCFRIM